MSKLSSEVLEEQFGPTVLEILYGGQDKTERIIQTSALFSKKVLELSRVQFDSISVEAFPTVHAKILNGTSIGVAFRDAGIPFYPERSLLGQVQPPPLISHCFRSSEPATLIAAQIFVGQDRLPYCDIRELYSPTVNCSELL